MVSHLPLRLSNVEWDSFVQYFNGSPVPLRRLGSTFKGKTPLFSSLGLVEKVAVLKARLQDDKRIYTFLSHGHFCSTQLIDHLTRMTEVGKITISFFTPYLDWLIESSVAPQPKVGYLDAGAVFESPLTRCPVMPSQSMMTSVLRRIPIVEIDSMAPGAETPVPTFFIQSYDNPSYWKNSTTHFAIHTNARRLFIDSLIGGVNPRLIRGCGHGEKDMFLGFDALDGSPVEIVYQTGNSLRSALLAGRIVHLFACQTGASLGTDIVDSTLGDAAAFFGYNDDIISVLEDGPILALFDHVIDAELVAGATAKTAYDNFKIKIQSQIDVYASSHCDSDHLAAIALARLRDSLVLIGDPAAKL